MLLRTLFDLTAGVELTIFLYYTPEFYGPLAPPIKGNLPP